MDLMGMYKNIYRDNCSDLHTDGRRIEYKKIIRVDGSEILVNQLI